MKKRYPRAIACALALALLLTQAVYASDALGSFRFQRSVKLGEGVTYTRSSLWSATYSDLRTEHFVTYTPNSQVTPMVYWGDTVPQLVTTAAAAAQMEQQGWRVLAGINGGFFNTNGTAVGMLMSGGILRALSEFSYERVGFGSDGAVFIDNSPLKKTVSWTALTQQTQVDEWGVETATQSSEEVTMDLAAFNTVRQDGGLYLFSGDFGSTTFNTVDGVDVTLRLMEGDGLRFDETALFEVVSVADSRQADVKLNNTIPAGHYILSANKNCAADMVDRLAALLPGTQVSVSITGADERWRDAQYGVSALYPLVKDGAVAADLPTGAAPRTAIGIKADGAAIFYTIDGRQPGYSVGAAYNQVAQRLIELGCITAAALDGGGSTTMGGTMPTETAFAVENTPSDGGNRKVNNSILLVTRAPSTGYPDRYYLESSHDILLAGETLEIAASAVDVNGYPVSAPSPQSWSATEGTVTLTETGQAVYIPPQAASVYTITASTPLDYDTEISGTIQVRVVDALSKLTVSREDSGKTVSSLKLEPGETVGLTAAGVWYNLPVGMNDTLVTWAVEGDIGIIDGGGFFQAGENNASGSITATAGGRTVTIPVTVKNPLPFTDVAEGSWYYDQVDYVYQNKLMTGLTGTTFGPLNKLTRGQLVTILYRMEGEPGADVTANQFVDVDTGSWYGPAVCWASSRGVVTGYVDDSGVWTFKPGQYISRQQLATMLYRYAAYKGMDTAPWADLSTYPDHGEVAGYARAAMEWAVGSGVITGTTGGGGQTILSPNGDSNRAQTATMISRLPVGAPDPEPPPSEGTPEPTQPPEEETLEPPPSEESPRPAQPPEEETLEPPPSEEAPGLPRDEQPLEPLPANPPGDPVSHDPT